MAVRQRSREAGFLLLEMLAWAACLGILAGGLYWQSGAYQQYTCKLQVRMAAKLLVADIRQLQQQSLFGNGEARYIRTLSTGYDTYVRGKRTTMVRFADYGWNVNLSWPMRFNVQFSNTGSPAATGMLILKHKEMDDFSCTLAVQPVTGRVVTVEE